MSANLPVADLTGAAIGTDVQIDFTPYLKFDPSNMEPAHLLVFNESGCGVQLTMKQSGDGQYLPAGGWTSFEIKPNDSLLTGVVTYALPNPPVSLLHAVYFGPGETLPASYTLGNSPIGIGGTVQTSSVQTLSNEGAAGGALVVDMGDTSLSQLVLLYNDGHAVWAVDQSGIRHQVIKIQTAGNPLQLGQANDTTEVLGNLTVDGRFSINAGSLLIQDDGAGDLVFKNNNGIVGSDSGGTQRTLLYVNSSNNTILQMAGNNQILFRSNSGSGQVASLDSTGLLTLTKIALALGSITRISTFTGSTVAGKVTANHGLGATPDFVAAFFTVGSTPSPHLIACNTATLTSTTVDVWSDVGSIGFYGIALKLT